MATLAGLRAWAATQYGYLQRSLGAQLPAVFCSQSSGGSARSEARPTSTRQRDGIRTIVLSDPKKRNALSLRMLKSLQTDILQEAESKDLRVIVISAEGPVFSSGHDLKELTEEHGRDYHTEVFQTCSEVMMLIRNHPVPVIAMVNGLATAAGCQLVASCDIAVASDKSSFATPGVNIGLFCSTPGVALGRAVPRKGLRHTHQDIPPKTFWLDVPVPLQLLHWGSICEVTTFQFYTPLSTDAIANRNTNRTP
ncbi:enoyl-CoA hydratase domain-containing protein 3, mitochondrial isoform X2 [Octodon degus]|uniref:Enoyl-CoA hydratase domain-containing protein 3, mitochondrial isoform X2 n=1 Tax=Octodon degus TaxID=10160 RepID=A0A6P6DBT6_OCTDE|nr:enoyl-CoA hydratase domain-containing protein 3, mitochondrial isoform X2 [Octodon degus]